MAAAGEPGLIELMTACAITRLIMGPQMNIQAPPNLSADYGPLLLAGINDWGGISRSPRTSSTPRRPGRTSTGSRSCATRPATPSRSASPSTGVPAQTTRSWPRACATGFARWRTRRRAWRW